MQLLAVLAPPPEVAAEALALARGACAAPASEVEPARGVRRWVRRAPAEPGPVAAFLPLDPDAVLVRVARLGNVGGEQVAGLAAALGSAAAAWPDPELHVAVVALDDTDPTQVVGVLHGQVGELAGIFRDLESVLRPHGFFLDRRAFRSQLGLGALSVPEGATVPSLLATATAVRGVDWRPGHLQLVRRVRRGGGEAFETVKRFELGTG